MVDFVEVPFIYSKRKLYLKKDTLRKFEEMRNFAAKKGITIYIRSATRNYQTQKEIWEGKFFGYRKVDGINLAKEMHSHEKRARRILKFSSMPGTSRHHWGTEIDILPSLNFPLTNSTFENGLGLKLYLWLRKNAARFGFCQPYQQTPQKRNHKKFKFGYEEEKWHWSYKPLSLKYFEKYKENIYRLKPKGFKGSQVGQTLYRDYVLNVHSECL